MKIGSLSVNNSRQVFSEYSRMANLLYSSPKYGKTTVGGTLEDLTQKHLGKPTLFIAVELGEGGGIASIREKGVEYVTPRNKQELNEILAYLPTDTKYGGVILDGATETNAAIIQPSALKMECKDKAAATKQSRAVGVPAWSDYQTMGEEMRKILQRLMNCTTQGDPRGSLGQKQLAENRKHLLVTALLREKKDKDMVVQWTGPQLPGQMAENSAAIFQTVMTIKLINSRDTVTKKMKVERRLSVNPVNNWILGDRLRLLPEEELLPANLCTLYEKYWIPAIKESQELQNSTQD